MNLFHCKQCDEKEERIRLFQLQAEHLSMYHQGKLLELHNSHESAMAEMLKQFAKQVTDLSTSCMDRIMARSYTEYAASSAPPVDSKPLTDEEEFHLEQARRIHLQNESNNDSHHSKQEDSTDG